MLGKAAWQLGMAIRHGNSAWQFGMGTRHGNSAWELLAGCRTNFGQVEAFV